MVHQPGAPAARAAGQAQTFAAPQRRAHCVVAAPLQGRAEPWSWWLRRRPGPGARAVPRRGSQGSGSRPGGSETGGTPQRRNVSPDTFCNGFDCLKLCAARARRRAAGRVQPAGVAGDRRCGRTGAGHHVLLGFGLVAAAPGSGGEKAGVAARARACQRRGARRWPSWFSAVGGGWVVSRTQGLPRRAGPGAPPRAFSSRAGGRPTAAEMLSHARVAVLARVRLGSGRKGVGARRRIGACACARPLRPLAAVGPRLCPRAGRRAVSGGPARRSGTGMVKGR